MFTLTYVYVENEISISNCDIWNDVRTKMIVLHLFYRTTWLNWKHHKKLLFIMKSETLICIWILVFWNGIFEVSTPKKWSFCLYFCSIQDCWLPSTWNSLVDISWSKMERCEKRAFQLLKMRKKNISWKIKTKYVTEV